MRMTRSRAVRRTVSCVDLKLNTMAKGDSEETVQGEDDATCIYHGWKSIILSWGGDTTSALMTHECIQSTKASISSSASGNFPMKDITFAIFVNVIVVTVSGIIVLWVLQRGRNQ
ncbi:hypothetical protein CEUSTIGMA_g2340.t1 [Chlamydomonas eustigma]|uniref:Uncharacterized protein n=1 Tax=Chlamydomonas eustigma TaxID=1157962 RepID=A0A250WVM9_9CHLO|nr:hypothetical protein CEUSTIGMA_g2340.t1 [Chlamydomonas eustigma]|eukprot:GAX74894.1 hypothetical protein CEUSTIGMA_g2340.t1 [Chlamydomonas eustigma]